MSDQNKRGEKQPFQIPPGGTLGLLALGADGVRAWRKAREAYYDANPAERPNYSADWEKAKQRDEERKREEKK